MKVTLWGTRGSLATPGPDTARYGGNTSCVGVRGPVGTVLVLDAGTGIRGMGKTIDASVKRVPGVGTKITQGPTDLSNRSPDLTIQWDGSLGITGQDVSSSAQAIVLDWTATTRAFRSMVTIPASQTSSFVPSKNEENGR
jgi:hypothetical protein